MKAMATARLPGAGRLDKDVAHVVHERLHTPAVVAIGFEDLAPVHRRSVVERLEYLIAVGHDPSDLLLKPLQDMLGVTVAGADVYVPGDEEPDCGFPKLVG